ncbi:DCC1-like thiol-disulfide oxidoreductase family protein [Sphingomonas sp. R86520]|uniref:DCC1-like thiol-disulfide oxidoreductase family protein n=1 Tax=Sphingomonas sp. R86520 TaxID=3093859 RepID=UPI0036D2B4DF
MTQLTVWHDGGCPLCRREIALMRRLDRRGVITFIDAESAETGCPIDRAKTAPAPATARIMAFGRGAP